MQTDASQRPTHTPAEDRMAEPFSLNNHRPQTLADFIGQAHLKEQIATSLVASRKRNKPFGHALIGGSVGLGKTTIARIIANERGGAFVAVSPDELNSNTDALQRVFADLDMTGHGNDGSVIGNIKPTTVFIDEAHKLSRETQERIYLALEDRVWEGKRTNPLTGVVEIRRLWIPNFTLLVSTNLPTALTKAFRDRLRFHFHLEPYPDADCALIARRALCRHGIKCGEASAMLIACRSRGTPRRALNIVEMIADVCAARGVNVANDPVCNLAFDALGIDPIGLERKEVMVLKRLAEAGRPVGLGTLSAILGEDKNSVESDTEPFLIGRNLLDRGTRGRSITKPGIEHLRKFHNWTE